MSLLLYWAFQVAQWLRIHLAVHETRFDLQEDPFEKEMATFSSILAWDIPSTEEPGGLQSMGTQRIRHDLVTKQQHYIDMIIYRV